MPREVSGGFRGGSLSARNMQQLNGESAEIRCVRVLLLRLESGRGGSGLSRVVQDTEAFYCVLGLPRVPPSAEFGKDVFNGTIGTTSAKSNDDVQCTIRPELLALIQHMANMVKYHQRGGDYGWFWLTLACGVSQWSRLWTWWRLNLSRSCTGTVGLVQRSLHGGHQYEGGR
ncbi:hypothetical protein WMY93_033363 [Mugilogobius chulae]|uniref:Uncharacterized protein n=1 Tax=Mugilogobius chulae TaxID=88201 RepID=A0AAW0MT14_9GOBI